MSVILAIRPAANQFTNQPANQIFFNDLQMNRYQIVSAVEVLLIRLDRLPWPWTEDRLTAGNRI